MLDKSQNVLTGKERTGSTCARMKLCMEEITLEQQLEKMRRDWAVPLLTLSSFPVRVLGDRVRTKTIQTI